MCGKVCDVVITIPGQAAEEVFYRVVSVVVSIHGVCILERFHAVESLVTHHTPDLGRNAIANDLTIHLYRIV